MSIGLPDAAVPVIDIGAVEINSTCFATFDSGTTLYGYEDASELQAAVDDAPDGVYVKVAGTCTGAFTSHADTRTVQIGKNLTLEGGYSRTNWGVPDPATNVTTLDAQGRAAS